MNARPENVLANVIANRAETMPDLDVLTIEGGGVRNDEVRSYRQLWDNGQRLARALLDQGLQPGERFALLMANHAEFVDAMVAASIAGVVFVPIDPRTRGDKLRFMLDNAQCVGVIAADYALDKLAEVRAALPRLRWVIGLETDEGRRPSQTIRPFCPCVACSHPNVPAPRDSHHGPRGADAADLHLGNHGRPEGHRDDAPALLRDVRRGAEAVRL